MGLVETLFRFIRGKSVEKPDQVATENEDVDSGNGRKKTHPPENSCSSPTTSNGVDTREERDSSQLSRSSSISLFDHHSGPSLAGKLVPSESMSPATEVTTPDSRETKANEGVLTSRVSPADGAPDINTTFSRIRADLIGRLDPISTPFGTKPLVYADWTASGRPLGSIETFMRQKVLPRYGNTHTTSSETGAQTTAFREEARRIIADAVNAKVTGTADDDVVIFTGSGSTGAVMKLVSALSLDKTIRSAKLFKNSKPVVLVGPFEHHSNLLPWRESCADVVQIAEDSTGGLDLADLENNLKKFSGRRLKIGTFAAASNVTGALEDTEEITRILHRGGALSFWDYATAGPYVDVNMNPDGASASDKVLVAKDAVFMSGHKYLGGAGTPGLLVCKRRLFKNKVPVVPGGGTVSFVSSYGHGYLTSIEEREEGGTPDILGAIRLGLAFQMKQRLGSVEAREEELAQLGLATWRANPRICLLGDTGKRRLPIFSFLIRHADRYFHHNFICALLNDLFGVQARAGCQCAGPYGIRLLQIPVDSLPKIKQKIDENQLIIKPGFCRLSLTFFMSDAEVKYILDAVMFVADHATTFLPYYEPHFSSAGWTCTPAAVPFVKGVMRKTLNNLHYGFDNETKTACEEGSLSPHQSAQRVPENCSKNDESLTFAVHLADALRLANEATYVTSSGHKGLRRNSSTSDLVSCWRLDEVAEAMRWFYFPFEEVPDETKTSGSTRKLDYRIVSVKIYRRPRLQTTDNLKTNAESDGGHERDIPNNDKPVVTETKARSWKGKRRVSWWAMTSVEEIETPIYKSRRPLRRSTTPVGTTPDQATDERRTGTTFQRGPRLTDPPVSSPPHLAKKTSKAGTRRPMMRRTKTLGDDPETSVFVRISSRGAHRELDGSESFWWGSNGKTSSADVWRNTVPTYFVT